MMMVMQDSVEDDDEYGTIPEEENQENLERNRYMYIFFALCALMK